MHFIAHRGNDNHKLRENTMVAITNSLNKDYIEGVEFDIRITKDNHFIIYHNFLIEFGNVLVPIKNKTLKDIKKEDKEISSLIEVLNNIKSNKIILLEIKEESDNFDNLIIKLFNILKKYSYLNLYICSFNYKLMKKIKAKYPTYKCGLIIGYFMNATNIDNTFDFYLYSSNYIQKINYNKEVFIFNINKKEKLISIQTKLKEPYYIITDNAYLIK